MKPFCIYFPQFHTLPQNDSTWGFGFTDWVLVANANLHNLWSRRSPQIGFYDGGCERLHLSQIEEMKSHHLGGIGLYHYWFYEGERVLEKFENTLLKNPPEKLLPWFFIWATESWSKRWLGDDTEIINLTHSPNEHQVKSHCTYLCECFKNDMYFKVDNRPVFIFFNLSHFKSPENTLKIYRKSFKELGVKPILGQFVKNPFDITYSKLVDVNYLFEPRLFFGFNNKLRTKTSKIIYDMLRSMVGESISKRLLLISDKFKKHQNIFSSAEFSNYILSDERQQFKNAFTTPVLDVISPGWNNVPRHGKRFTAIENLSADEFEKILKSSLNNNTGYPTLINAWNEWSEGAALEPCKYLGTRYLDVVKKLND